MPLRRGQRHREVRWVDICHALYMTGYMEDFSEAGALPVCAVAFIKAWAAESGKTTNAAKTIRSASTSTVLTTIDRSSAERRSTVEGTALKGGGASGARNRLRKSLPGHRLTNGTYRVS